MDHKTKIVYVKPFHSGSIHYGYALEYSNGAAVETEYGNVKFFKTKFDAALYRALNNL